MVLLVSFGGGGHCCLGGIGGVGIGIISIRVGFGSGGGIGGLVMVVVELVVVLVALVVVVVVVIIGGGRRRRHGGIGGLGGSVGSVGSHYSGIFYVVGLSVGIYGIGIGGGVAISGLGFQAAVFELLPNDEVRRQKRERVVGTEDTGEGGSKMAKTAGFGIYTSGKGTQVLNLGTSSKRILQTGATYEDASSTGVDLGYKPRGLR
ncbi:uncharacterized protein LOC124898531 [Capsicum annuum]|uniref:uncharacterized protein LOC124898531 n=1 Tax=Capsicum annuum TaxID=4072 RepID=UPI001FB0BE90|nr:uncharacterized protein LOC124898531 [Capsicum annuum]